MPLTALDLFIRASDALFKFEADFNTLEEGNFNVFNLEIESAELKLLWEKVRTTYEACLTFLETAKTAKSEDMEATEAKYRSTYRAYVKCLTKIKEMTHNLAMPNLDVKNAITDTQSNEVSGHNFSLPPCNIPMFNGDFISWPTFRDLFTAIYMNCSRLSKIEKLCHLLSKTSGDAHAIVSKFPLTNSGFDIAWRKLSETYENPRMIVNNELMKLFKLPHLERETSEGLKNLQREINGSLSTFSTLDLTAEHDLSAQFIVFICIQRLPANTVTLWEATIRDKKALSQWADLDVFLTERISTLECSRELQSAHCTKRAAEVKVKAHVTTTASTPSPIPASTPRNDSCVLCRNQTHFLAICPRFKKLSVYDRFSNVKRFHCCINCLSRKHELRNCTSSHTCSKCKQQHHTLLHRDTSKSGSGNATSVATTAATRFSAGNTTDPNIQSTSSGGNPTVPTNRQILHSSLNGSVLMGTAMVNILHHGVTYPARALIDPCAEASLITERLKNRLGLSAHSTNVKVNGTNQSYAGTSSKVCSLRIGSLIDSTKIVEALALVLPSISGKLPSVPVPSSIRDNLPKLCLADATFFDSRPVDLLLGAEVYAKILIKEVPIDITDSIVAQNTIFGWVITGSMSAGQPQVQVYSTQINFSEEDCLNRNLLRFWELEETPKRKILSAIDKICEENYRVTTKRASDGRYVVTLPFKPEFPQQLHLGLSRPNVLGQYLRNEASLLRKPEIKEMYDQVVKEYVHLGHMKPVKSISSTDNSACYLPHHPVIKMDRKTTKLRVVFNASNRTSNGHSLNDCLYVGPALQADLCILVLRWRLFKFVFNCDITQMYRQIRVDPAHTPFQRILFRDSPTEDVKDYELQTVTFGVNCAPYLAIRTLLQLADDSESEYPLASHILRNCMYVDDVLAGSHDISTALIARDQLISALRSAKFELRKWTSNEKTILDGFAPEHLVNEKVLTFVESSTSKTLGIQWNAQLDSFYFNVTTFDQRSSHTKREVLSAIAKLFDPVGWLGPVIIVAKIIMQRVWLDNIDWDDCLPSSTEGEWQKFLTSYHEVNSIRIPRWVNYKPNYNTELHVFSDASEKAYAGVIYIRIETSSGEIHTHLLSGKTKVAPIKSISIPRLELCGAVLASELLKNVVSEIDIKLNQIYCWTDSTIVLSWLRKDPCSWTTFVANRVCRIQENVGKHNWHHVRSEDNPADLSSRGLTPSELANNDLWWHGPHWLRRDKSQWNITNLSGLETDVESKTVKVHFTFFANSSEDYKFEDILSNYSRLDKALRIVSYILRFFYNSHPSHKLNRNMYAKGTISSSEVKRAKMRLAMIAQKIHFSDEYKCLLDKKPISSKSPLVTLNPFLDENGVIRLNGRLVKSPSLTYSEQHPIILPYSSRFTQLLIEFVHLISIHGGNQLMLRILRIEYWVPRLKSKIRAVIGHCKRCILDKKRSCSQIMAALPSERTVLDRPFTTTGIDFAGPFDIKSFTGRLCKITKGYVCIFVCFSTKAIHLEVTSDLSTATFLLAFQRFISRRGCPGTIFSDNGTNFVGASRELERDFKSFIKQTQSTVCSMYGIQGVNWRFIPAGAPHMGGLWEAGVKSFKVHFRKEAQAFKYTFEELSSLLARIEACLNSRPLCPMSENPQEPAALTPGHFLIGSPVLAPPEPSIQETPISLVNRFQRLKALSQHFCNRWKEEYLKGLHKRYKWQHPERELQEDDIVVIRHENLPPTSWRLGRVEKLYPGSDGHVRVVDVRTANGVVRRSITKLVVLTH